MADVDPVVWYADSEDPFHLLRRSGGPLVVCALLPTVVLLCGAAAGIHVAGSTVLLVCAFVPIAMIVAGWEFVRDRQAVVEMRLTGDELTLVRVNRTRTTYPVRAIHGIEVIQARRGGRRWSSMRVRLPGRVERTRTGPADLPPGWFEAVRTAEIDVHLREKHYADD